MDDFRSRSYGDGRMQMESYYGGSRAPTSSNFPHDLRSYSASYAQPSPSVGKDLKFKKGKSAAGSVSKSWSISDPEFQRKKRVASYKVYAVEGRVKGSFRRSFRWLKDKYTRVVYGWW